MVQQVHRRYAAYAGFVTTPQYFDDSPQQFLQVAPAGTGILQRVNHIDGYRYELGERASNFDLLEESAGLSRPVVLRRDRPGRIELGALQRHPPPDDIEQICADISARAGARFFMAGHCLVEGLRHLGAETITVANGYYRPDWSAGINAYLEAAGFRILWAGDLIDQGLVADHDEKLRIEAETLWDYPAHLMAAAAIDANTRAPQADAVVQTGAGFRMLQVVDTVEGQTGTPLVASDFAPLLGHAEAPRTTGRPPAMATCWAPCHEGGSWPCGPSPDRPSTAFEWMMRVRGDFSCFHEPFGEGLVPGRGARLAPAPTRQRSHPRPHLRVGLAPPPGRGRRRAGVHQGLPPLPGAALDRRVPVALHPLVPDPPSGQDRHLDVQALARLHPEGDRGSSSSDSSSTASPTPPARPPPVIDSDDLLADPAAVVEAWCTSVGIPFLPAALSWEPGPP